MALSTATTALYAAHAQSLRTSACVVSRLSSPLATLEQTRSTSFPRALPDASDGLYARLIYGRKGAVSIIIFMMQIYSLRSITYKGRKTPQWECKTNYYLVFSSMQIKSSLRARLSTCEFAENTASFSSLEKATATRVKATVLLARAVC